ncbi:MAG TPA: hypothetical protein VGL02_08865 [Streptomyces sp.]
MIDQKDTGHGTIRGALPVEPEPGVVLDGMDDGDLLATIRSLVDARDNLSDPTLIARVQADIDRGNAEVARRAAVAEWRRHGQPAGQHRLDVADDQHTQVLPPLRVAGDRPAVPDLFVPAASVANAETMAKLWTEGWPPPVRADAPEWTPEAFVRLHDELAKPRWLSGIRARLTVGRALVLVASAGVLVGVGVMWLVTR